MRIQIIAPLAGLVACGLVACSSSSGDAASTTCGDAPAQPNAAKASFRADVVPIFQTSCAFSSCHGAPSSAESNGIFLGLRDGTTDPTTIHDGLVGQSPRANPGMPYVLPSNPGSSFLVRKIEGDFCGLACTNGTCGDRMPKGGDPLDPAARSVIATWIARGAPND
jgi:hypothetical protein